MKLMTICLNQLLKTQPHKTTHLIKNALEFYGLDNYINTSHYVHLRNMRQWD